jgi:hypothetical protein
MPYTFALSGCVFQQDAKRAESHTLKRYAKAFGASPDGVLFARASGASRMNNQIIRAQLDGAQNLFAKRGARLFKYLGIAAGQIDQIIAVNNDRRDSRLRTDSTETLDLLIR